jgi:hypothetical protein
MFHLLQELGNLLWISGLQQGAQFLHKSDTREDYIKWTGTKSISIAILARIL